MNVVDFPFVAVNLCSFVPSGNSFVFVQISVFTYSSSRNIEILAKTKLPRCGADI